MHTSNVNINASCSGCNAGLICYEFWSTTSAVTLKPLYNKSHFFIVSSLEQCWHLPWEKSCQYKGIKTNLPNTYTVLSWKHQALHLV